MSDDLLQAEAELQRSFRRRRLIAVVVVVLALGGAAAAAWQVSRYETLILDKPIALLQVPGPRPEAPGPGPSVLNGVDLRRVHTELLGTWTIQAQKGGRQPAGRALARAIDGDSRLSVLFEMIEDTAEELDRGAALELTRLFADWSAYLDKAGAPWFISVKARGRRGQWSFYLKIYEVLADTSVTVGGRTSRVRILRRVDQINVRDGMLGHSGLEGAGAVLVADNLVRSFVREVWPALGGDGAGEVPSFSPAIQREAARALSAEQLALLRQTAGPRANVTAVLDALRDRRDCSGFRLRDHWYGVTREALDGIHKIARRMIEPGDCPPITVIEAVRLGRASTILQETEGLTEAVAAGVAWYARAVALHEARHIADNAVAVPEEDAPPLDVACPGCKREIGRRARVELSAYAAELTHPDTAVIALLQMCASRRGHKARFRERAERLLLSAILPEGCDAGVPDDLVLRGRRVDEALFERRDSVSFEAGWPSALPPWTRTDW